MVTLCNVCNRVPVPAIRVTPAAGVILMIEENTELSGLLGGIQSFIAAMY